MIINVLAFMLFIPLIYFGGKRIVQAWQYANTRQYTPPSQLGINKNNEWVALPGSQRVAWWRTFINELIR